MAVLSAAKGAHWVISRKAIQTGISGIEIVFRHECRTSTPVFNLITLYRHQSQFFRINKYTESYYDNLPTAQKTKFAVVYWLMLLLDIAIVASELLFFFVWNRLADTDYELAFYILDVISISYSTLWYVIPMSQYFLCVYILVQSLQNEVSHLHSEDLNTSKLQRIALNIRSILNVCDLVKDYYGVTVLLGFMCSILDFIFFPYVYVYITHLMKLSLLSELAYKLSLGLVCGLATLSKLAHMYILFMVCEMFYEKVSGHIIN
uniref:Uncharacterized protein n=1 Tax=Cacopsylla melanoneura TaxID=428564 RepID=A0A8D9EF00_9HEMI